MKELQLTTSEDHLKSGANMTMARGRARWRQCKIEQECGLRPSAVANAKRLVAREWCQVVQLLAHGMVTWGVIQANLRKYKDISASRMVSSCATFCS